MSFLQIFAIVLIGYARSLIDKTGTVFKSNEEEARVELASLARVQVKILLADSTKFDKVGFFKFYDFKDVSYLATDKPEVMKQYDFNVKVRHRVDTSSKFVSLVRLIVTLFKINATIFLKK